MKKFAVEFNDTIIPDNHKCLFMDISHPELLPLRREFIKCMSFVHWLGPWQICRNGDSQERHIDFYWIYGHGFTIESASGVICPEPGDLLVVPSWFDRIQRIGNPHCPHIYIRTDDVDEFPQFQEIFSRRSLLGLEFLSDVIRLARLSNPLNSEKLILRPLAELIAMQFHKEVGVNSGEKDFFREKIFTVLNREPVGLSVPELAQKLCISESGLYKKCMQLLNRSPGQLLTEHRLLNARQHLLYASSPLSGIAKLAGYADEFAFSKAFRKYFGISPAAYRKKFSR
jgi:AraC-like DNA-binding protein